MPGRVRDARALASARSITLAAAEQELFGVTHAEVSGYVLGLWRLPR
jgi:HD-like signal output (HDOD) protein